MSLFDAFSAGWTFRTSTPSLTVGDEVSVFIHRHQEHAGDGDGTVAATADASDADAEDEASQGVGVASIGDTQLYVDGTGPEHVDKRVRVRITEYDESTATGRGEFVAVVGESSYAG